MCQTPYCSLRVLWRLLPRVICSAELSERYPLHELAVDGKEAQFVDFIK